MSWSLAAYQRYGVCVLTVPEVKIMYCPNCGLQNEPEINFCRACGTNLNVVSQALTNQTAELSRPTTGRDVDPARITYGLKCLQIGFMAVLLTSILLHFGMWLGVLVLIPGVVCLGKGLAVIVRGNRNAQGHRPPPVIALPARDTGGLNGPILPVTMPPPSVTEATTRHLESDRPRP